MTNDWIDDTSTSFDDKLAYAEQFAEVGARGPILGFASPADTVGSTVIPAPEMSISFGSSTLLDAISPSKTLQSA